jgi:hypothetical protein
LISLSSALTKLSLHILFYSYCKEEPCYCLKLGLVATPLPYVQKYYKVEFNQVLLGIPFPICFILLSNDDSVEFLFQYLSAC